MRKIDLAGMEHLAHALAKKMMTWNEPIPPFNTRFPGVLESCIEVPFAATFDRELYPTLTDKAAMFFYVMIKNHPFQNGNKRIAVTTLVVFVMSNDHWLTLSNQQMYELAIFTAKSNAENKDLVIGALRDFFGRHLQKGGPPPLKAQS